MKILYSKRASGIVSLFVICTFLSSLFSLSVQKVNAEELLALLNPGFEEVESGKPADWSLLTSMAALNTDTQYVRSGSNSVKINDTSTTSSALVYSAPVTAQPGVIYEASVYCYGISGVPQLYLEFYNSSNTRIGVAISTLGTLSAWSRLQSTGIAPEGTAYAKLLLYISVTGLGEAYFDDAALGIAPSSLKNPGFEEAANGKPADWSLPASMAALNTDPQYVRSGSNSVKIADTSTTSSVNIYSAPIPVRPGIMYEASVYCYGISGVPQLYLEFYNSSNTRIGVVISTLSTLTTWSRLEASGIAPEGTAYAKLLLYISVMGLGEAYFDDAAFIAVPGSLQNPSFEAAENNMPVGWVCSSGSSVSLSTEKFYDGEKSLKISNQNPAYSISVRSKPIPIIPGGIYEASVYSYNESGISQMYFEYYDSTNTRIDVGVYTNSTLGEWRKMSGRREAPAAAAYAKILLYSCTGNTGTSYYDKACFSKLDKTLLNGGFEEMTDDKPSNWNFSQPDGSEASTASVYEGSFSLKLTDTSDSSALNALSGKILVQEDNIMKASVYSYNEGGSSILSLRYYDPDDNLLSEATAVNDSGNQWKLLEAEGTAPYNTSYLTVCLSSSPAGTGSVFFDNAGLVMVSDAPVYDFPLLVTSHPRLYFTEADIPALREKALSTTPSTIGITGKDLWTSLENTIEGYLQETSFTVAYYNDYQVTYPLPPQQPEPMPPPPGFTAGAYPYWTGMSREIQKRLEGLSLAYCVTGNTAYSDLAKSYALSVCSWNNWSDPSCPIEYNTNLDTAHLTLGVCAAYDMLYNLLSDSERTTIENALTEKGLEPLFEDVITKQDHNIQMLRACALGTGSIALLGKNPNAAKYLTRATSYYKWYLDTRMNSGQQEGLGYTAYATEYLMKAIDQLARVTGERDLVEHPFINDFIVRWALYSLIPGGTGLANFSDAYVTTGYYITMNVAGQWLDNGYAGWYLANAKPTADNFEKFIYFKQDMVVTPPDDLDTSAFLDVIGWASLRTGWGKNDTMLEFISNNSKVGHNHYDQNSFIIGTNNTVIAADPGYQDYSAGPVRDFTLQYGHNTIYVDGKAQSILGNGSLTKGLLSPVYDYVSGSAANAYSNPSLAKFDRHIVNIKPGYYVILDDLAADVPRTYDWMLYTGSPSEFDIDGNAVTPGQGSQGNNVYIHKGAAQMAIKFLAPGTLPISVQTYPGAEAYGPFVKVGSGAASSAYKYLAVIKTAEQTQGDEIKAVDLGEPVDSSGQEFKYVTVNNSLNFFYKALAVDDYFTMRFNVDKTGDYEMGAVFLKSPMYGKVQVYVDGQPAGGIYDGYNNQIVYADEFDLGLIHLTEGSHEIKFRVTGKNDNSGGYYIGLYSLKVVPTEPNGTPQGKISVDAGLLQADNVIGAAVADETSNDYVLFKTGNFGSYTVNNIHSDAAQSYISTTSSALSYAGQTYINATQAALNHTENSYAEKFAMTRGSYLRFGETLLLTGDSVFSAALGINKSNYILEGVVETESETNIGIHTGSQASVMLDGEVLTSAVFDDMTKAMFFTVPAGFHRVAINATQTPVLAVYANDINLDKMDSPVSFTDFQPVTFNVSVFDTFSGVASIITELDGKALDIKSPASFTGAPGEHCLTVTAADKAGNTVSGSYKFEIVVNIDSLDQLLERYITAGELNGPMIPQLKNSLSHIAHQLEKGSCEQAAKHMEHFIKHLNNPALSQYITEAAKKVLNTDANWLISNWLI